MSGCYKKRHHKSVHPFASMIRAMWCMVSELPDADLAALREACQMASTLNCAASEWTAVQAIGREVEIESRRRTMSKSAR